MNFTEYTMDQLRAMSAAAYTRGMSFYDQASELPVLSPEYRIAKAAGNEQHDLVKAIGAEMRARWDKQDRDRGLSARITATLTDAEEIAWAEQNADPIQKAERDAYQKQVEDEQRNG